jgi:hypothetical protein
MPDHDVRSDFKQVPAVSALAPHVLDNLDARANGTAQTSVRIPTYMLVALVTEVRACRLNHNRHRQYVKPRRRCDVCGKEHSLRSDGTFHAHQGPHGSRCAGSHQPPKETP